MRVKEDGYDDEYFDLGDKEEKPDCARCQILDQLSPYKIRQELEIDMSPITHLLISSNSTLKTTQINVSYERNYDEDYEMGPISQFLENLILHSMSTRVMDTPAQKSIEEIGGSAKCEVNQFKVSFTYYLPFDAKNNQNLLRLCREDLQTRIGTPSMIIKRPEDLIPYIKSKLMSSYEIWNHVLLGKIWSEKNPSVRYATFPLIEDSTLVNKMKNIIMGDEAVKVAARMDNWRAFIILQSKLGLDELQEDFDATFSSFFDSRNTKDIFVDGKHSFKLPESTHCIVNTPVSCATSVMMTWPIPIDRMKCNTAYHLIFDAIFEIGNLKKMMLHHRAYDIKIHSKHYAQINNVLHLILTIEIGTLQTGVRMNSLSFFILEYLATLLNDQSAIEKIIAIYHQKLSHMKFHNSYHDIDEVANQMLFCHGFGDQKHTWQTHLSLVYNLKSFDELVEHFRIVIEFLLHTKFTVGIVTCLYKDEDEAANWDFFDKYTGSLVQLHGKLKRQHYKMEFDWALTSFPRIICINSNPKIDDSYPDIFCVKDTDSYSLNEIPNNIYSHHQYLSIRVSPHGNLQVHPRYFNILNLIMKNAIIIVAERGGFNPMSMGTNFDSFLHEYSSTFVFQSDHKIELPIIHQILTAIHKTSFVLNESADVCDQALKRTVDQYRAAKNLPEGHDNVLPNLISDMDLDTESSISFIKSFNKTGKIKIISAAFLSTCKIDITISTPSGTRPLTNALVKKLTELFEDFDRSRGFVQNVKLLDSYMFKSSFSDLRELVKDEDLLREKISKHFAIIGTKSIDSVVNIVPHGSCYAIKTLFKVSFDVKQSDEIAIFAAGAVLDRFIPNMLEIFILNQNDRPADLNLIKIKVETLILPSIVLQVHVNFTSNNFIDSTKYLLVKIGSFLSQTKASDFDIEKFLPWEHSHHLTESAKLDELRVFSEVCEHFIVNKSHEWNKLCKTKLHWYSYDLKLEPEVLEIIHKTPNTVCQYIDKIFRNLNLAYVYQQRPVHNPNKLATRKSIGTAMSANIDTEMGDNPDMAKERLFFMQTMPLVINKNENNQAKFTTVHQLMQPKE